MSRIWTDAIGSVVCLFFILWARVISDGVEEKRKYERVCVPLSAVRGISMKCCQKNIFEIQ